MVRRKLEELNLVDNFLFGSVLNYPNLGDRFAKILLKIILEMEFGDLKIVPQRVFYGSNTDKHGTQLDVHIEASIAEDSGAEQENVIDLEPDQNNKKNICRAFAASYTVLSRNHRYGMFKIGRGISCIEKCGGDYDYDL